MTEESKRGYVIRDRRRVDSQEPSAQPEGNAQADRTRSPANNVATPSSPRQEAPSASQGKGATPPSQGARTSVGGGPETVDFSALVLSVATNAMIGLEGRSPDGRLPGRPNLAAAAQHIDILTMLEEKTRGNLTPDENDLLRRLLYDLRMHYLEVSNQGENRPKKP